MKSKSIALFGGAFNPPHLGHQQVIEFLAKSLKYKEIWIIPSFLHPYAKDLIDFKYRQKMCELMIDLIDESVFVNPVEARLQLNPGYTIDVVRNLKKIHRDQKFTWILGSDSKNDLKNWKNYDELIKEVEFSPLPRAGFEDSPFLKVSSSEIRQLIRENKDWEHLVPESIVSYIKRHNLYEKN